MGKKRPNLNQMVPRLSEEAEQFAEQYNRLKESLEPVFEWQRGMVGTIYNLLNSYLTICPVTTASS